MFCFVLLQENNFYTIVFLHYRTVIIRKHFLSTPPPVIGQLQLFSPLQDDIREEAIEALDDLMGEQGKQGLADLMTSLGMSKPLNTKEERVSDLTCSPPSYPCFKQRLLTCMSSSSRYYSSYSFNGQSQYSFDSFHALSERKTGLFIIQLSRLW